MFAAVMTWIIFLISYGRAVVSQAGADTTRLPEEKLLILIQKD